MCARRRRARRPSAKSRIPRRRPRRRPARRPRRSAGSRRRRASDPSPLGSAGHARRSARRWQAGPHARHRPSARVGAGPKPGGRRASSRRARGRGARRRARCRGGPWARRPRRLQLPSARARRRARRPRSGRAGPPSPPPRARRGLPGPAVAADSERARSRWRPSSPVPSSWRFLLSRMDFKRPARSQRERTRREDRRSKFYELRDNLGCRLVEHAWSTAWLSTRALRVPPATSGR